MLWLCALVSKLSNFLHQFILPHYLRPIYFSEYCEKYAKKDDVGAPPEEKSSDEELSEEENVSSDDEVAGKADP